MVLSHPYMEDSVALPSRSGIRCETRLAGRDPNNKKSQDDLTLSTRCSANWISLLVEKHAWLSAGLIWLPEASATGKKVVFNEDQQGALESIPKINVFELLEEGTIA